MAIIVATLLQSTLVNQGRIRSLKNQERRIQSLKNQEREGERKRRIQSLKNQEREGTIFCHLFWVTDQNHGHHSIRTHRHNDQYQQPYITIIGSVI